MNYTRLEQTSSAFSEALTRFGITTVMNAKVYDVETFASSITKAGSTKYANAAEYFAAKDAYAIYADLLTAGNSKESGYRCYLDTLKTANVSLEGPTKTVTGGQYANPLIKFGKTATMEIQDALGNAEAIEALCGGLVEYSQGEEGDLINALHNGTDFSGPKLIWGESFIINQKTGAQQRVAIIFYQFLPDSLFNLTQDAEGDATVFDMNGSLLTTDILVNDKNGKSIKHGTFYSILEEVATASEATAKSDINLD